MNWRSVKHVTCNEVGREEVTVEFEVGWFRRHIFRQRPVRTFELWPTGWRDKETGEYASLEERFLITAGMNECGRQHASYPYK